MKLQLCTAMVAIAALTTACADSGDSDRGGNGPGIMLMDAGNMMSMPDSSTPPPPPSTPDASPPPPSTDCTSEATFTECAQCFAASNMEGGNAYITAIINNIYCGSTCGMTCGTFCTAVMTDPNAEPSMACGTCADGLDMMSGDVANFRNECQSSAACVDFANNLQMCPRG